MVWKIGGIILLLFLGIWVLVIGIWGFGVATAGIYGRGEAYKEIQSADFRIEAYQHFFDSYSSIKGLEGKIVVLADQLKQFEEGTRDYTYTVTQLSGAKGLLCEAVQKYNADAQKDWTQGQFRDNDLPYQLAVPEYCLAK